MTSHSQQSVPARRIPVWLVALLTLGAVAISNADVLILVLLGGRAEAGSLRFALATAIPLSLGAAALTLGFILRLQREVSRGSRAEQEVRATLAELSQALDRENLLRRELDHRVRNNLSALLALVGMYEQAEIPGREIAQSLRSKILALREAYRLIAEHHGEGIDLSELMKSVVSAVLAPGSGAHITMDGPPVKLSGREANAFAMIMQELLTNASKHGALRNDDGAIEIRWTAQDTGPQKRLALRWSEQPVTSCTPANGHRGTGLSLIESLAACDLRGSIKFAQAGDCWNVHLFTNSAAQPAAART